MDRNQVSKIIEEFAVDDSVIVVRQALAEFTAETFLATGHLLQVVGNIYGSDRKNGVSPFGNGSDETVAVSLLLRIAGQLTASSATLFKMGQDYSAAALVRQVVEIEYLAWAFETRDADAEKWLRSDKGIRQNFFQPRILRQASAGKFRGKDYAYHCECGGHPVPGSSLLLGSNRSPGQIMFSDLLGHTGRIWDHVVRWASEKEFSHGVLVRAPEMSKRYNDWKLADPLTQLPPPP